MSEENKPHDEAGPAEDAHVAPAETGAAPVHEEAAAVEAAPHHGETPEPAGDSDADVTPAEAHEAVESPETENLGAEPVVEAEAPVEPVAEVHEAVAEVAAEVESASEPEPAPEPEAEPVKQAIWSDQGDAPFEEPAPAPVYAGGKSKTGGSKKDGGNEFVEILKTVVFALLIALVIRVVLFQPFTIPSASMEPNLYEGDYIVVSKWSYGYSRHAAPWSPPLFKGRILASEPKRGDVAVFKWPGDLKTDYIKRVIGLPGDTVQMINNQLYLNGAPVPNVVVDRAEVEGVFASQAVIRMEETLPGGRTYAIQEWGPGHQLDNTERFVVPAGHYFMIGDNRDNSLDSRATPATGGVGLVPAENLIGKAEIVLASWSPGASLANPISWFTKLRLSRFFTVLD